jgi:hypothetical protein
MQQPKKRGWRLNDKAKAVHGGALVGALAIQIFLITPLELSSNTTSGQRLVAMLWQVPAMELTIAFFTAFYMAFAGEFRASRVEKRVQRALKASTK